MVHTHNKMLITLRCSDNRDLLVDESCLRKHTSVCVNKNVIEIPFPSSAVRLVVEMMKTRSAPRTRLVTGRSRVMQWVYKFKFSSRRPRVAAAMRDRRVRECVLRVLEFVGCKKTLLDLFICIHMYYCLN